MGKQIWEFNRSTKKNRIQPTRQPLLILSLKILFICADNVKTKLPSGAKFAVSTILAGIFLLRITFNRLNRIQLSLESGTRHPQRQSRSPEIRAYPEISRVQIAQQIFCRARRFDAGILTDFKSNQRGTAENMQASCARIILG